MVRWRKDDPALLSELDAIAKTHAAHVPLGSFAWLLSAQLAGRADAGGDTALQRAGPALSQRPALRRCAESRRRSCSRSLRRYGEAAERLERLQRTYTSALLVGHYNLYLLAEGALLLGQIYLEDMRQPARAIPALTGFLKRQPTSRLADDALLLLAEATRRRHTPPTPLDKTEACRHLARLYKQYPTQTNAEKPTN